MMAGSGMTLLYFLILPIMKGRWGHGGGGGFPGGGGGSSALTSEAISNELASGNCADFT